MPWSKSQSKPRSIPRARRRSTKRSRGIGKRKIMKRKFKGGDYSTVLSLTIEISVGTRNYTVHVGDDKKIDVEIIVDSWSQNTEEHQVTCILTYGDISFQRTINLGSRRIVPLEYLLSGYETEVKEFFRNVEQARPPTSSRPKLKVKAKPGPLPPVAKIL